MVSNSEYENYIFGCLLQSPEESTSHWNTQTHFPLVSVCCLQLNTGMCHSAHNTSCSHLSNVSPRNPIQVNWAFALQFLHFKIMIIPFSLPRAIKPVWMSKMTTFCSLSLSENSLSKHISLPINQQVLTVFSNRPQVRSQDKVPNIS